MAEWGALHHTSLALACDLHNKGRCLSTGEITTKLADRHMEAIREMATLGCKPSIIEHRSTVISSSQSAMCLPNLTMALGGFHTSSRFLKSSRREPSTRPRSTRCSIRRSLRRPRPRVEKRSLGRQSTVTSTRWLARSTPPKSQV